MISLAAAIVLHAGTCTAALDPSLRWRFEGDFNGGWVTMQLEQEPSLWLDFHHVRRPSDTPVDFGYPAKWRACAISTGELVLRKLTAKEIRQRVRMFFNETRIPPYGLYPSISEAAREQRRRQKEFGRLKQALDEAQSDE